jgi:hypothetical protein
VIAAYKVESVPTIIVDGRYMTSPSMAHDSLKTNNPQEMFQGCAADAPSGGALVRLKSSGRHRRRSTRVRRDCNAAMRPLSRAQYAVRQADHEAGPTQRRALHPQDAAVQATALRAIDSPSPKPPVARSRLRSRR